MADLGPLDRNGLLYRRTPRPAATGTVRYTETLLGRIALTEEKAPVQQVTSGDRISEQADAVFKSRWFDGLAVDMKLSVEGRNFLIKRRAEIGRREGWRIFAREIT